MFSLSFYGRKEDVAKIKKNILDIKLKLAEMWKLYMRQEISDSLSDYSMTKCNIRSLFLNSEKLKFNFFW